MAGLLDSNLLLGRTGQAVIPSHRWFYLTLRFNQFLANLTITEWQREDGQTKQANIRDCLNQYYWGVSSETANSMLIGSWGKRTQVRPSRDIDILFLLPSEVYHRFQTRGNNRQSQLLQEVKGVLSARYSQTALRGDGQVVSIPFNTIPIEIVPGFRCQDGSIIICDTNDGGNYKTSTAEAEENDLTASDMNCNFNSRALARILKCWQRERSVGLKSFQLERLAVEFLSTWPYRLQSVFYYDWMIRDFLEYLIGRANSTLFMPGTGEAIFLGSDWLSCAQSSHRSAIAACSFEYDNLDIPAGQEWQKLFGNSIPVSV
jgi:hypothetical protein